MSTPLPPPPKSTHWAKGPHDGGGLHRWLGLIPPALSDLASRSGGTSVAGSVATFADLPATAGDGQSFIVRDEVALYTRNNAGQWVGPVPVQGAATEAAVAQAASKPSVWAALTGNGAQPVGRGEIVVNILDFGAVGNGSTDNRAAIQAAIDSLGPDGGKVHVPNGNFRVVGDITGKSFLTLGGNGYGSRLHFDGGGLIFRQATKFAINDLRVSRVGAAGPAISILPGATNGCSRWSTANVNITASTGSGWFMQDTWIVTMVNPIIQGCQVGMDVAVGSLFSSSANGVSILGGEWQANVKAGTIRGVKGWAMNGLAVEGNTAAGLEFVGTNRDVKMDAVYFEGNPGYDIVWDCNPSGGYGLSLDACGFLGTAQSGPRAIYITRGQGISINACSFVGYQQIPILIDETPAAGTSGVVRNCTLTQGSATRVLEVAKSRNFGDVVTTRHQAVQTAANGVRTEFARFPVEIPLESADVVTATITYTTSNTAGNVYVGVWVADPAGGATIQTLATQKASTTNQLTTASFTIDVSAHRGKTLWFNFRRMADNALDTYTGSTFTYFEGKVDVRHGYRR